MAGKNACSAISRFGSGITGRRQERTIKNAMWSLGVRLPGTTWSDVEAELETGKVLRTWPMRGTIHLVPPEDAAWMVRILGEKPLAGAVRRREFLGLEEKDADRAVEVLADVLAGGGRLTRAECVAAIEDAGISGAGQRGYHLLWYASQHGVTCIAPNVDGEQTFALLHEWAPEQRDVSREEAMATSAAMGSVFFVEVMGAGSGHLALACAYQARAEGLLVNEHPDPDAYIDEVILGTLKRTLGVPNKSHLFVVAERTPHRHHREGGVHGLVDYVASAIGDWPQRHARPGQYPLTLATKATILGHTLRGAPPTPEDKAIAQHLAYETVRRLVERPEDIVGCMLAYRERGAIEPIPLHAVASKQFDWDLFARMHGRELIEKPS